MRRERQHTTGVTVMDATGGTAESLALRLLRGRQSAWLSVKQAAWLRDVIVRETQDPRPGRVLHVGGETLGSYQLVIAPNGAGLLKAVAAVSL